MTIQQEFNCLGYYGFGNGVEFSRKMTKQAEAGVPVSGQGIDICSTCVMGQACWAAHRGRVAEMVPDIVKAAEEHYKNGGDLNAFVKKHGTEPYIAVMTGNMEDGGFVASTGRPKDRGEATLPYPFEKLTD